MGRKPTSNSRRNKDRREAYRKEQTMDALAEFEEVKDTVLPQLRKLLAEGAGADKMRVDLAPLLQARLLSIALTSKDEGKSLTAIIDSLNRAFGKPKEQLETTHKFEKMREEELDALLNSRLKEAGVSSEEQEVTSDEDVQH